MLVICEDCGKKYNIDESRIKGKRARFTCNECGHIIIIDKADLSRPLIHSSNHQTSPSSSIDLIKEMETPFSSKSDVVDDQPDQVKTDANSEADNPVKKKGKSLTITAYFMIAGVLSFLITTSAIGFILAQHYSKIAHQQMELHSGLLITSVLVMLGAWGISFGILFGIGTYLSRSLNNLTAIIIRIGQGEKDLDVVARNPRELSNMAQCISALCSKNR